MLCHPVWFSIQSWGEIRRNVYLDTLKVIKVFESSLDTYVQNYKFNRIWQDDRTKPELKARREDVPRHLTMCEEISATSLLQHALSIAIKFGDTPPFGLFMVAP